MASLCCLGCPRTHSVNQAALNLQRSACEFNAEAGGFLSLRPASLQSEFQDN